MEDKNIYIEKFNSEVLTIGLKRFLGRELRISKGKFEDDVYEDVLNYVINYITVEENSINPDETIAYYSWLLKFIEIDENYFELWEVNSQGSEFVSGVDLSIMALKNQLKLCAEYNVEAEFPTFSQKVTISKGVFENEPIQAVRYSAPDHMTGWYLTTPLYNGDIKSLKIIHYYDLIFKRPDLLKYLALPKGFRFSYFNTQSDIWYDIEVAEDSQ